MLTLRGYANQLMTLAIVSCVVAPIASLAWLGSSLDAELQAAARNRINVSLDILSEHTLKVFETAELLLHDVTVITADLSDAEILQQQPRLHGIFRDMAKMLPQVLALRLIDGSGQPLVSSVSSPGPGVNVSEQDFYREQSARDAGTYIGAMAVRGRDNQRVFTMTRRRPGADGSFNGVVVVSLLATDFENFFQRLDADPSTKFAMVRADGTLLARQPPLLMARQADPRKSVLLREISNNPDGTIYRAKSNADGVERIVGYRRMQHYPVYLVNAVAVSAIDAQFWDAFSRYLEVVIPAALLLLGALLIIRWRTQRLYAAAEGREAAENALAHARRMGAIGQLTGGIAHDFNNLLMIVQGSAERLRRLTDEPNAVRALDMISGAVANGARLTRHLLAFSRRQPVAVEVVDLAQHLEQFQEVLRQSLRGDIGIVMDMAPDLGTVRIDSGELDVALLNIASNARDAMPAGGTLWLSARPVTLHGTGETNGLCGAFVALSVRDSGGGMAPEARARAFEPFFTTKDVGKGTGLGLSQVYGFARQSGGLATASSVPGGGTTITLYLPSSLEAARPLALAAAGRPPSQTPAHRARRVLLVEDNHDLAEVSRGLLEACGYVVGVAGAGREALDRLSRDPGFDIVLSDIMMPGELNGIELARALRTRSPTLPVVLTTGYSVGVDEAEREGFAILAKPYDSAKLCAELEARLRAPAIDAA